jgi:hypothetical protein
MVSKLNALKEALIELQPQDMIEGMWCSRLLVLHDQSIDLMRKAKDATLFHQKEFYYNSATKLMRLCNETLDALNKHRRKGEQKVTVQHVNVSNGGQAIVGGNFTPGVGGGINS